MNKQLKKIAKKICKLYWKTDQMLYVSTPILHDKRVHAVDVFATKEDGDICNKESIYLFSIRTQETFIEDFFLHENTFRKSKFKDIIKYIDNTVDIAHTPLYIKELFTLKRLGTITEKDIEGCTRYFIAKVLDMFAIFNLKVLIEYDKPKKKGLDLSEMKNYDGIPISTNPGNHELEEGYKVSEDDDLWDFL